jgi:excisionase family DNA binding protein
MGDIMSDGKYLSVKELAEYLCFSLTTCYKFVRMPDFPASKVGKKYLIDKSKLDSWIQKHREETR